MGSLAKNSSEENINMLPHLVPSKERICERIQFWDNFNERYENAGDGEEDGFDLDTIVAMEEAEERKQEKRKKKSATRKNCWIFNQSRAILKSVFDEESQNELDGEDCESHPDSDVGEEEENDQENQQIVPYEKRNPDEIRQQVIDFFGLEFIARAKQEVEKLRNEISKMKIPSWDYAFSRTRFREDLNEQLLVTPKFQSFSRRYERNFEQISAMNLKRLNPEMNNNFPPSTNRFHQNNFHSTLQAIDEQNSNLGSSVLQMPEHIEILLRQDPSCSSIRIIEREYVINRNQDMLSFMPTLQVEVTKVVSKNEGNQPSTQYDERQASSCEIQEAPEKKTSYSLIDKPEKNGNVKSKNVQKNEAKAKAITSKKIQEKLSTTSLKKGRVEGTPKPCSKTVAIQPKSSIHEATSKSNRPEMISKVVSKNKSNQPSTQHDERQASLFEIQEAPEKKTSYSLIDKPEKHGNVKSKNVQKNEAKSKAITSKKIQEKLSTTSPKKDCFEETSKTVTIQTKTFKQTLSDISIGSSYQSESSDEDFFNKKKYIERRERNMIEHKKKKLQSRSLQKGLKNYTSDSSDEEYANYTSDSSDEEYAVRIKERKTKNLKSRPVQKGVKKYKSDSSDEEFEGYGKKKSLKDRDWRESRSPKKKLKTCKHNRRK